MVPPANSSYDFYPLNTQNNNLGAQIYDESHGENNSLNHNNFIWNSRKFAAPAFIQFGKAYEDYAEPDPSATPP